MSEPTRFWPSLDSAAIAQSHIGDETPVSRLNTKNRPPGDERGKIYSATNLNPRGLGCFQMPSTAAAELTDFRYRLSHHHDFPPAVGCRHLRHP
jgi:hypothetical protein